MISRAQAAYHASIGGRLPTPPRPYPRTYGWKLVGKNHWSKDFGDGWVADVWMVPSTGKKPRWWTFQVNGPGDRMWVEPKALLSSSAKAKRASSRWVSMNGGRDEQG